jgi:ubiquinone/menaquinone biosynthesis C-methylase UbiE
MKLNLGAGENKLPGFINIDIEKSCKPDVVCNFVFEPLPYRANSIEEVTFFHCIEHIQKKLHRQVLLNIWRVLKPGGKLYISYPEFIKCVENWKKNYKGLKEFWEATIFGRQLYPSDTHVCIMNTPDFIEELKSIGYKDIITVPELVNKFNTSIYCTKGVLNPTYEDSIRTMMKSFRLKKL